MTDKEKIKKAILMLLDELLGTSNETYWKIYSLLELDKVDD